MSVASLLDQFTLLATAPEGVKRLRELILELAVRGKLVPQDANDEPASDMLKRIQAEKARLVAEGKIKKDKPLPTIGEDEKPFELPAGWAWSRLGELGNIFNGNSINASEKEAKYAGVEGLPFIATKDVGYGLDPLDYSNGICIPPGEDKFKVAHQGAVLICAEGGSAGRKCGLTDRDICFGNKLFANELYGQIPSRLMLYLYLSPTFRAQFNAGMSGIIGGVSLAKFAEIIVPLPPLAEQHRIVAKVDELMALCDQLEAQQADAANAHATLVKTLLDTLAQSQSATDFTANWQRLAQHFDTLFTTEASIDALKQTVLQLAVMGKLAPQDPDDESASKLLKGIQDEKAKPRPEVSGGKKPFGLPKGWEWVPLDSLLEKKREISYGVIKLGPEPRSGGIPTLRCSDVRPGWIDLSGVRMVSEEIEAEYVRTRLKGGEILLNIRGTLGGVALAPKSLAGYNVAREVAVIPVSVNLHGTYLTYVMLSQYFWQAIQNDLRGIAYKGLNLGSLRTFPIPVPPLAEQHRIVAKVDELMSLCDQLTAHLKAARELAAHYASAATAAALEAA